jgi:hypothetical protein
VASRSQGGGAVILGWPDDRVLAELPTRKPVWGYWSTDGRWCVLGGSDAYTFWRTGEWAQPAFTLPVELTGSSYGLAVFSPDSRQVAIATGEHTFGIAPAGDWRPRLIFTLPGDATIDTWTWADNHSLVVFGGAQQVMVFDPAAATAELASLGLAPTN